MQLKLKNKVITTAILSLSTLLLSFCVSKMAAENYTITWVQQITVENGEKTTDNFYGIFPKNNDTVVIYKAAQDDAKRIEKQYRYTFKKPSENPNAIEFYYKEDTQPEETVKVRFEKNNVVVNDDTYKVNEAYYKFLMQKVLQENSILEIAALTKDGLGDYKPLFEPLNKNWGQAKAKSDKGFKILEVAVKNRNYQTDSQFFQRKVNFSYDKQGNFLKAEGENYKKIKAKANQKYFKYDISETNDRSSIESELYQNKKTLSDSVIVKWEQYSTAKEYSFVKYQSKLHKKTVSQKPKADSDFTKFF
ncbi:hypothetical protein ABH942_000713 [Flavobacterium sp. 28YEA47A]|uniref:hypothetical protein n=1 Tax=Flavobacterium sp. 28YEA47A TaxID=3156276 RepID=UPI00351580F3